MKIMKRKLGNIHWMFVLVFHLFENTEIQDVFLSKQKQSRHMMVFVLPHSTFTSRNILQGRCLLKRNESRKKLWQTIYKSMFDDNKKYMKYSWTMFLAGLTVVYTFILIEIQLIFIFTFMIQSRSKCCTVR